MVIRGAALSFLLAISSCASSSGESLRPSAALANSVEAQAAFRALQERWRSTAPDTRGKMADELVQFVQRYPQDGQSRMARLYLAWIRLSQGRLEKAESWLKPARTGEPGAAGDFLELVEGARLTALDEPHRAYAKLKPLAGRLIDGDDRLLCLQQLVLAALAAEQYTEALQHILDVAALSARRHRERVWLGLERLIGKIPSPILESQLLTSSLQDTPLPGVRQGERTAARRWLNKQIRFRLSRSALAERDVGLAQRLVSTPSSAAAAPADSRLVRLATQAAAEVTVDGRSLGLVLELGGAHRSSLSVEISSGVATELGAATGGDIRLLTEDVRDPREIGDALRQLAGRGAGLLAAGVTAASASEAALFAREHELAVLLLHPPLAGVELPPTARVIGADAEQSLEVLRAALRGSARRRVVEVGSGATPCPSSDPYGDSQAWLEPLATLSPNTALLLGGSSTCSLRVLSELGGRVNQLIVGIGIESYAALESPPRARQLLSVGAGRLPSFTEKETASSQRWASLHGRPPSWHEGLGHDLAVMARVALSYPADLHLQDAAAIRTLHAQLLAELDAATFEDLWTTQATQLGPERTLPRSFEVVRLPRSRP